MYIYALKEPSSLTFIDNILVVYGSTTFSVLFFFENRGAEESSRFRKNVFAYAESHGLGQSGGGKAQEHVGGSYVHRSF